MADDPARNPAGGAPPMTEMEKWKKGWPFNSAKLWQEMDDAQLEAIREGVAGDGPAGPAVNR